MYLNIDMNFHLGSNTSLATLLFSNVYHTGKTKPFLLKIGKAHLLITDH